MAPSFFNQNGRASSAGRAVDKRQDNQAADEQSSTVIQASSTPSPSPAHHNSVPKIGGSEGGFIGLVVALSLIFILCSIAIFFLLRNHEPSARERAQRRHHSIRRKDAPQPIPIALHEQDTSFTEKLGSMFKGRRAATGWVQASGDEWDSGDEDMHKDASRELNSIYSPEVGKHAHIVEGQHNVPDAKEATPMNSTSSGTLYSEPPSTPRIHIQAPSGVTPEYWHGEGAPGSYFPVTAKAIRHGERQLSSDSAESVQTFAGGTKFKEIV